MPKARQVIQEIEDDGWRFARQRGSHLHFHHPNKPGTVTVPGPLGRDIKTGTYRFILKQAGIIVPGTRE